MPNTVGWFRSLGHRESKKRMTVRVGFLLMYAGIILLLLPAIVSALFFPLTLSETPQIFDFEGDSRSYSSAYGAPTVVTSPSASGSKAVECQNGDYISWDLATPSKTLDLTFKIYWTKFPTIANESLILVHIFGLDGRTWQDILSMKFYCSSDGHRGWSLWTGIPSSHGGYVSGGIVRSLETDRWYTIRMTADLNTGTYKMYMGGTELASINDVEVPEDVYIDFFRLGAGAMGNNNSNFTNYYDDVAVSLLNPSPSPKQWALRITSSSGGSTNPYGVTNVNDGQSLTIIATKATGYVFNKWILDGADFSTNSTVTLPAQSIGTQHTLHATFTSQEPPPKYNWLPLQVMGLGMAIGGGYILWPRKKQEQTSRPLTPLN